MLPVVTPKNGMSATLGTSAASRSRDRGPWTARMPYSSLTSSMATSSRG